MLVCLFVCLLLFHLYYILNDTFYKYDTINKIINHQSGFKSFFQQGTFLSPILTKNYESYRKLRISHVHEKGSLSFLRNQL